MLENEAKVRRLRRIAGDKSRCGCAIIADCIANGGARLVHTPPLHGVLRTIASAASAPHLDRLLPQ